ncbi:hypothetical protein X551_04749 [Methylibium sp. T29]|nr:hypothetical protein X551_04749 [Methylibium sp. T29]
MLHHPAVLDRQHIGACLIDAHGRRRHAARGAALQLDAPLGEQALAQAGLGLDREIDHYRTRAGLGGRVDAGHARQHRRRDAVDLQAGGRSDAYRAHVLGRDRRLELDPRQIDDLDQLRVDRHAFTGLRSALRHLAGDRRTQHRVVLGLARQFGSRPGRLQRRTCGGRVRDRRVERVLRDEALIHQGAVVLQRALGDVELRAGLGRLLLRLAQLPGVLGRVDSTSTWPAVTRSPSRTLSCCTSPATLAFTTAEFTAFSAPVISSVRSSSRG